MSIPPYKSVQALREDVELNLTLHPKIQTLIQLFLKYLKEPRYQAPLTVSELSKLFHNFYQDLNVLAIGIYTQSNSTKKSLISNCDYFNDNPKVFDYLLAIANYSTSAVKMLKRTDDDALYQLRIFNYYKFLVIFQSIHLAQLELFSSVSLGDDVSLYERIFKFDQKDIIYSEFLQEKLDKLKRLELSFKHFIDPELGDQGSIVEIMDDIQSEDLSALQENLSELRRNVTPYSKLVSIVNLHKNLIKLFVSKKLKNKQINNDLLLPSLIYLLIYKLDNKELYLNFLFIKNFLNTLDSNIIELYPVGLNSSYNPSQDRPPTTTTKCKKSTFIEFLNLTESDVIPQKQDFLTNDDFKFFENDKELIAYINQNYLNTGELFYYLTNLEAIIVYLSNTTIKELLVNNEEAHRVINSDMRKSRVLNYPISALVDEELMSHFQFPEGELAEEIKQKEETKEATNRSRSSSFLSTITHKISETRSRSNSSLKQKETFPSLGNDDASEKTGFAMMKNILERIGSVSISQVQNPLTHVDQENEARNVTNTSLITPQKRSNTLMSRISPSHTRTRSSSLETGLGSQNPFASSIHTHAKKNSISSRFTTGVSEFMTKLNAPSSTPNLHHEQNISNSSLHTIENGDSQGPTDSSTAKIEGGRSRTTSLQILDKWFNNLNANAPAIQPVLAPQQSPTQVQPKPKLEALATNHEESVVDVYELTKYQNLEFDTLTIKEIRELKGYYDQLCTDLLSTYSNSNGGYENNGKIFINSRNNSIDKTGSNSNNSRKNSIDKLLIDKIDNADTTSKAESIDSSEKLGNITGPASCEASL
ncbi:uncharacterized protein J8A68_003039 [[Candida] subhashii]|uniref:VPS9 domain-containing protein n=1 Tax=[Candida] subhashii TaxID=561895 RepID=A0A8J5QI87_9ASCO|nr:uncharacterized protein J8A68_003039 [[Candida] subhashii]KAG7663492.1 hypothetical protein J8A68_003039 [[Candida] subhashii]